MKRFSLMLLVSSAMFGCGQNGTVPEGTHAESPAATAPTLQAAAPQADYDELLKRAEEFLKNRDANQAVKVLTQAVSQEPQRTEGFLKRAAICSEANLLPQAIVDMTAAIKLQPDNAKFLNTRGYFLLLSKQYDRAESDFSDAIGLDLAYPQPYNNRGLVCVAQGKFEEAIKNFDNALKAKPDYLDAHNNRGFALLQSDQNEAAVAAFDRVLEMDPDYINGLTNRARAMMKLERPLDAILDLTRAIQLQPDHIPHWASRAEAYSASGNETAASLDHEHVNWLRQLTELNQRIARAPRDADAWARRGRHLLLESRHEEARKSFDNALTLVPAHPQALLGRAELALELEQYEAVISDCTDLLQRDYNYETCSLRGDAYFALGKFGEAIADYESARRFDERVVSAYLQRAQQLRGHGDEQLALADEKMAASLQHRLTEADSPLEQAVPREMIIEQASYEEPSPAKQPAPVK